MFSCLGGAPIRKCYTVDSDVEVPEIGTVLYANVIYVNETWESEYLDTVT